MRARGGHGSPMGIIRDCEKSNEAQLLGYAFFRLNEKNINTTTITQLISFIDKRINQ